MARTKKGGLGRGLDSLIPIGIMEETEEVEREVADRKAARARAAKLANESKKTPADAEKNLNEKEELVKELRTLGSQTPGSQKAEKTADRPESKAKSKTASKIEGKTESKTGDQIVKQTENQTEEQTVKQTEEQTEDQIVDQTENSELADIKTPEKTLDVKSVEETEDDKEAVLTDVESKHMVDKDIEWSEVAADVPKGGTVLSMNMKEQERRLPGTAMLKLSEIEPNREQPRKDFNEDALQELAESIRLHGVIQPLIVQKKGEYYGIIAGERRWRAAKIAGLKEVPVIIREYTDREVMEISLIENIQREDLNAIEEAKAYQRLIQEFHLKQEDIAVKISKSRAAIANTMRLLKLDERVQNMLIEEEITSGHARALLPLEDGDLQYTAAQKIASETLSVRETEKLVKLLLAPPKEPDEPKTEPERDDSFIYQALEEKMKSIMGTKVSIHKKDNNKGRIEIEYYSPEELERIVELFETIK